MIVRILSIPTIVTILLSPAAAGSDFLTAEERASGRITACSSYNESRCYTARLVASPGGYRMRLKNGTMLDCSGDCRDALRRETVDFWQDQRERNK